MIPILTLKHGQKPNGGLQSINTLQHFIITDWGKQAWIRVAVYDDEMNSSVKGNARSTS